MNNGRRYYFLTIAETLNITRAAEKLRVSQPSLTQYLNRLEKDLGIKLLDRNFTPLRLTRAGNLYYDYLVEEKSREEQFAAAIESLKNEDKGTLRIGIPLQKRHEGLSAALLRFCMERPDLDVRVWEGTSSTVRERVLKGELDIGFGHSVEEQHKECVTRILAKERIVILCSRENPIVQGRASSPEETCRIAPAALNGQLFYQMSQEYYLCTVELAHMKKHGVDPHQRIIMSHLHAIIEAILQNPRSGFAYMPDYVLREHWPRSVCKDLAFLRLDEEDFTWYFSMFRKKGRPLSQEARAFWNCVAESCCEEL
ncbi:MAG: LysR family transcriptional regulator [Oscillospiraceae bacterium]|nr:LysR family transcriptional regulator [Oscillospiraceae bacterium]